MMLVIDRGAAAWPCLLLVQTLKTWMTCLLACLANIGFLQGARAGSARFLDARAQQSAVKYKRSRSPSFTKDCSS